MTHVPTQRRVNSLLFHSRKGITDHSEILSWVFMSCLQILKSLPNKWLLKKIFSSDLKNRLHLLMLHYTRTLSLCCTICQPHGLARGKKTLNHFYTLNKSLNFCPLQKNIVRLKNAHSLWIYDKQNSINNASKFILRKKIENFLPVKRITRKLARLDEQNEVKQGSVAWSCNLKFLEASCSNTCLTLETTKSGSPRKHLI